jgi:hypothetical protein
MPKTTKAATEARVTAADERYAARLRGHGYTVIVPVGRQTSDEHVDSVLVAFLRSRGYKIERPS